MYVYEFENVYVYGLFQEIKTREEAEFLRERKEDEMEMSDSDSEDTQPAIKRRKPEGSGKSYM